jgi:signal transduction histidine kinase
MSVYPAVAGRHVRLPHWMSIPALVAVFGLAVTLLVTGALHQAEQRRASALLDRQSAAVRAAISAEANRYVDTLTDLSAAVGAQTDLSATDYAAIMSGLSAQRLLGASGISLVVPASAAGVPDLQQVWRDHGSEGLALTPGSVDVPHRFVVLARSLDGAVARTGRDLGAVAPAREAMDLARERGAPTASETYVLSRDAEELPPAKRQLSFVVAAPVVDETQPLSDGPNGGGPGEFRGWLLMGMRGQSFLAKTLQGAAAGQLAVQLRDGDRETGRLVASWPPGRTTPLDVAGAAGRASRADSADRAGRELAGSPAIVDVAVRTSYVVVAGRRWTLSVAPLDGVSGSGGALDTVVLTSGTAISLLLAALVGALSRSRDRALVEVGKATSALRADVARREEIEVNLRRREKELAGFAGVAAHDFRTPLSTASAYLEILADDGGAGLDVQNREFLGRARSAVSRTDRMLSDLLGYATADQVELDLGPVDLAALAAEVVAERTDHLPADPERVLLDQLPVVRGDAGMLRQVLDNLIGNALKYTAVGRPPRVRVTASRLETGWRVDVADQGIGIPADEWGGVFDAFHRGAGSIGFSGSGLGLAICRRIVERHGGTIGVTENPGGGSLFWFALAAEPARVPPAYPSATAG